MSWTRISVLAALVAACGGGDKDPGGGQGSAAPKDPGSAATPPAKPDKVTVVVTGQKVTINGTDMGLKPMIADLEKVLGKPDRTSDMPQGVNKIYTWDKYGVVAYDPKDGRCISTTFPYKPMGTDFSPKAMFNGTITVDGKAIPVGTDIGELKKVTDATQPYGADSMVINRGEIHVFTSQKGSGLDLVEVSYWNKPKPVVPLYAGSYKTTEGAMTLRQTSGDPATVSGTYAKGKINCTADGDNLDCKWVEPSAYGRAKFTRDASGNLKGTWGSGGAATGGGGWACTLLAAGKLE
jgi:hypothetical protein